MKGDLEGETLTRWLRRPQTMIALSAVVLSLCGLFVAMYEASLIRRSQRAAVWPHLDVSASISGEKIQIAVRNTGVGPARVDAAAIFYEGELLKDWSELVRSFGLEPREVHEYRSLINGRVIPVDPESEAIFRITPTHGPGAGELITRLGPALLSGRVEVLVCYCSVFDDCWIRSLQEILQPARTTETPAVSRPIPSCRREPRSAI